jgi:hypothetical protein
MATIAESLRRPQARLDTLSGTPRAHSIDRWIFVLMAAWFIAIVLTGFIPDSLHMVAAVQTGERSALPLVLHVHAVLMGSFLLVLLGQTWLMATGRTALHMQLGVIGIALAAALVVAGFILVPTNYHLVWDAAHSRAAVATKTFGPSIPEWENIMLLQMRIGILFSLFLAIALKARNGHPGIHKRMIILATAMPLAAAIERMSWLPSTMPTSPLSPDLYILLAASPMFAWDVVRNRRVHEAYWIWLALWLPFAVLVNALWDTAWWHSAARQLLAV